MSENSTEGSDHALEGIFAEVYNELYTLAHQKMAHEPAQTIGATALVHEAFLRLQKEGSDDPEKWASRPKFFSAAAEAMRRILIDRARARMAVKRGGDLNQTEQSVSQIAAPTKDADLIAIDEALAKLEATDAEGAELVKLKYFVGLNWDEIAEIKGMSTRTLRRQWAYARAFLRDEIERELEDPV